METVLNKSNVVATLNKVKQYAIIAVAIVIGFFVGKYVHTIELSTKMSKNTYRDNPYRNICPLKTYYASNEKESVEF